MAHITRHSGPVDPRAEIEEAARQVRLEQAAQAERARAEHITGFAARAEAAKAAAAAQERLRQEALAAHAERRAALMPTSGETAA